MKNKTTKFLNEKNKDINSQKKSLLKDTPKISDDSLKIISFWIKESRKTKKMVTHSLDSKIIFKLANWLDRYPLNLKKQDYKEFKIYHIKRTIKIFRKLIDSEVIDIQKPFSIIDFLRGKMVYIKNKGPVFKEPEHYKLISDRKQLRQYLKYRGNPEYYKIANNRLKELYKILVLDEKRIRFTQKQEEQFSLASKRLVRYMIGNKKLNYLDSTNGANLDDFIRILISALRWHYKNKPIGVGHLCSNYTFTEILPKFINFNKPR